MDYKDLTHSIIEKHIDKKFEWFERHPLFTDYVRVHFDRERYLPNCVDIDIDLIKEK